MNSNPMSVRTIYIAIFIFGFSSTFEICSPLPHCDLRSRFGLKREAAASRKVSSVPQWQQVAYAGVAEPQPQPNEDAKIHRKQLMCKERVSDPHMCGYGSAQIASKKDRTEN